MITTEWDSNDSDILLVNVSYPLESWQEVLDAVNDISRLTEARNTPVFVIANLGDINRTYLPGSESAIRPIFEAVSSMPENLILYAISPIRFLHLLPTSGLPSSLIQRIYAAKSSADAYQQIAGYRSANGLSAPDAPTAGSTQESYLNDTDKGSSAGSRAQKPDQDR